MTNLYKIYLHGATKCFDALIAATAEVVLLDYPSETHSFSLQFDDGKGFYPAPNIYVQGSHLDDPNRFRTATEREIEARLKAAITEVLAA